MCFIKGVIRKHSDLIENRVGSFHRYTICHCPAAGRTAVGAVAAVNECLPFPCHDILLFLRHSTADNVGSAIGIAGQHPTDLP